MAPRALQFAMAAMDAGKITNGCVFNHQLRGVRTLSQAAFNVEELPASGIIFQMPFEQCKF
jgi:hypothetical protein